MGGLTRTHDTTVELARLMRKFERRLKALFIQAGRVSRKIGSSEASSSRLGARTPLSSPRQLFITLSNKAAPLLHRKKIAEEEKQDSSGAGGVWQRDILMGEKCQPLDFSGAIHYDNQGKLLTGIPPRSPRGGCSPMVQSFSFQVPLAQKSG
ncbi:hypothetical protein CKAN_01448900 [Cinnamomum micranthum f. kanehirae]|uniref:Uncharacterized protein n=1 Tax=Cinnamomum micranthum f. kanehirae TaxID=337451 RepID=A0A443P4C0_9MAGN|nr:hypothetical protein CKAN_01448900 [Cinnamomum micranthum f. kanehirae]